MVTIWAPRALEALLRDRLEASIAELSFDPRGGLVGVFGAAADVEDVQTVRAVVRAVRERAN